MCVCLLSRFSAKFFFFFSAKLTFKLCTYLGESWSECFRVSCWVSAQLLSCIKYVYQCDSRSCEDVNFLPTCFYYFSSALSFLAQEHNTICYCIYLCLKKKNYFGKGEKMGLCCEISLTGEPSSIVSVSSSPGCEPLAPRRETNACGGPEASLQYTVSLVQWVNRSLLAKVGSGLCPGGCTHTSGTGISCQRCLATLVTPT